MEESFKQFFAGISQLFRMAIPGVVIVILLKFSQPTLFQSVSNFVSNEQIIWGVFAITVGMIAYALHRSGFFILDVLFFFRTSLTAVHEFRRQEECCKSIGPWVGFLMFKHAKDSDYADIFKFLGSRWSLAHSLCIIGESTLLLTYLAEASTSLEVNRFYGYTFGMTIFAIGFLNILFLYQAELHLCRRLLKK